MISLLKPQWSWWSALRTNRAASATQRDKNTIFRCWCDSSISGRAMWRCDVYLASYSRHVLDVWSDHFRHIVCIVRAAFGTHLQYRHRENHPRRALYFHFSIFLLSLVSESERGNLHYDKVAISRDLLAQSDLVTGPCIMYEQQEPAKYHGLGGGGGGFLQQIFLCG